MCSTFSARYQSITKYRFGRPLRRKYLFCETPVISQYCVQCTTLWMAALYSVHQYYLIHPYSIFTGYNLVRVYKCTPVSSDASLYCVQFTTMCMCALHSVHQYYLIHPNIVYNVQPCGCMHCTVCTSIIRIISTLYTINNLVDVNTVHQIIIWFISTVFAMSLFNLVGVYTLQWTPVSSDSSLNYVQCKVQSYGVYYRIFLYLQRIYIIYSICFEIT